MDWLRAIAVAFLLVVAMLLAGAAVRAVVAAGDPRAAATLGLVALFVAVAAASGARSRRWRRNPYW